MLYSIQWIKGCLFLVYIIKRTRLESHICTLQTRGWPERSVCLNGGTRRRKQVCAHSCFMHEAGISIDTKNANYNAHVRVLQALHDWNVRRQVGSWTSLARQATPSSTSVATAKSKQNQNKSNNNTGGTDPAHCTLQRALPLPRGM